MRLFRAFLCLFSVANVLVAAEGKGAYAVVDVFHEKQIIIGTGKRVYPTEFLSRIARLNKNTEAPILRTIKFSSESLAKFQTYLKSAEVVDANKAQDLFSKIWLGVSVLSKNDDQSYYFIASSYILENEGFGSYKVYPIAKENRQSFRRLFEGTLLPIGAMLEYGTK